MKISRSGIAAIVSGLALTTFVIASPIVQHARKSTEPPVPNQGKFCSELFMAISHGDAQGVDDLLAKGADPNSRNGLGFAPLYIAAASHQSNVVDALLKAGAKPDAESTYGTPLTFACMTGNVPDAMKFLGLGAKPDFLRTDGMSPLSVAANSGCTPIVEALIQNKVDLDTQDDGGFTALTFAARGGALDAAKALVEAGAKIDMPDVDGITPLMYAAMNGHANVVSMLLEKGANANAVDNMGRTALLLAASYVDSPEVVKALLAGKANPKAKDSKGRTAAQIAAMRGYTQTAAALTGSAPKPAEPKRTAKQAVLLSLNLIQASTKAFEEGATCVSCHQEGLGRMVTGEARVRGFKLDPGLQHQQDGRINGMINALKPLHEGALKNPELVKQLPLVEINEVTTLYGWLLEGAIGQRQAATPALSAMTMCLARQQSPSGAWTFAVPRVPMQGSFFSFTAYALHAMNAYAPKDSATEIAKRKADALQWLRSAKPQNSEDRASRLMALKWAGATKAEQLSAAGEITKDQHADGGWAQLPGMASDAYATGQALYALKIAGGVSIKDPLYQKGEKYLLRTQDDDGSWFVNKRALQANNYFDSSFPHGESQYSSFNGTCWAVLALMPSASVK